MPQGRPEGRTEQRPGRARHERRWPQRQSLQSVKRLPNANPGDKNQVNAEADLSCSGEGSRWNAKEIWHVQTIDGNKVAVVTGLKQTDYRDEKGRKQNTPSLVTTTVYFACK